MGLRKKRMRRIKSVEIQNESLEDQIAAGRSEPCLEVVIPTPKGKRILKIEARSTDEVTVFKLGKYTLVVNINRSLNYIGLEIFDGEKDIVIVFFDEEDVRETFRKQKLTPEKIARTLFFHAAKTSEYLYDY